jgi:hypothetical protein
MKVKEIISRKDAKIKYKSRKDIFASLLCVFVRNKKAPLQEKLQYNSPLTIN